MYKIAGLKEKETKWLSRDIIRKKSEGGAEGRANPTIARISSG